MKNSIFSIILVTIIMTITGCGGGGGTKMEKNQTATPAPTVTPTATPEPAKSTAPTTEAGKNPIVTIKMENGDVIKAELYPKIAPNTVNSFISLINKGFYNGVIFHRVIPGFMIQGGDPDGTGMGGPGYSIKGEFTSNKFANDLKHTKGVLSMARSQANDSGGSQFFIMVADAPFLDGQYAGFGKVTEGIENADKIVSTKTGANDRPVAEQKMKTVTVETFGVTYPEPNKM